MRTLVQGLLALAVLSPNGFGAVPGGAPDISPTFVYIHGFGGEKSRPQFCENLSGFLEEHGSAARVINYEWDSIRVDPLKAGASWIRAQKRADEEALVFKRQIIDQLEAQGRPYVLVGFSVGSRVVLRALERVEGKLDGLAAVYFLGSALTKETTLERPHPLPEGVRITNYHSPLHDHVHRLAFSFMSDIPAGGQVGFDDEEVFDNYLVSCTHTHKGVGLHIDYSGLAEAICAIELYRQGFRLPGKTKLNFALPVGGGGVWWNKVLRVGGGARRERGAIEIEQHSMRPGYYRAMRVEEDGSRRRVARGDSLHAILGDLGVRLES